MANGLGKANRNAKSGNIGITAVNQNNYFKDNVNSVSPLQLHQKQLSEVTPLQAYGDKAYAADEEARPSSGATSASGKHPKSRQSIKKSVSANDNKVNNDDELQNLNTASKKQEAQSSELAKIQPTAANRISHELLVKQSETQQRTELVT